MAAAKVHLYQALCSPPLCRRSLSSKTSASSTSHPFKVAVATLARGIQQYVNLQVRAKQDETKQSIPGSKEEFLLVVNRDEILSRP